MTKKHPLLPLVLLIASSECAMTAQNTLAAPVQPSPADKPIVKKDDGSVLMWEVPEKQPKVKSASPEDLRKINQAKINEGAYLEEAANQNVLVAPNDGTAAGAITQPFLPYSTVPGGPYSGSGSVITPFNNRSYSYGGTSQSFGAPIFSGVEVPSPALGYPAGYPIGGSPLSPFMGRQRQGFGGQNVPQLPGNSAIPPAIPTPQPGQGIAVPHSIMPPADLGD